MTRVARGQVRGLPTPGRRPSPRGMDRSQGARLAPGSCVRSKPDGDVSTATGRVRSSRACRSCSATQRWPNTTTSVTITRPDTRRRKGRTTIALTMRPSKPTDPTERRGCTGSCSPRSPVVRWRLNRIGSRLVGATALTTLRWVGNGRGVSGPCRVDGRQFRSFTRGGHSSEASCGKALGVRFDCIVTDVEAPSVR